MTATTPPQVAASFWVDVDRLHEVGMADPYSPPAPSMTSRANSLAMSGTVEMLDAKSGQGFATLGAGQSFGEQAIVPAGVRGTTLRAREQTVRQLIAEDNLKFMLEARSPVMTPVVEALLLQQGMHKRLRTRAV